MFRWNVVPSSVWGWQTPKCFSEGSGLVKRGATQNFREFEYTPQTNNATNLRR